MLAVTVRSSGIPSYREGILPSVPRVGDIFYYDSDSAERFVIEEVRWHLDTSSVSIWVTPEKEYLHARTA